MVLNKTVKDQTTQKPEEECLLMVLNKTVKDESTQKSEKKMTLNGTEQDSALF